MAASTKVFSTQAILGAQLGTTASSTPAFGALTRTWASDGHNYVYVKATTAIGSTGTVKIGASGSATTDSGSAGFTANVPGGAAANQYFWAKKTVLL